MTKQLTALQKINWRMGLWLPAVILLSNPYLHVLDLMPDAIGYVLLLIALRRVSALDESFGEVARALKRLTLLSVARLGGLVWIYTATSASEQPTLILILCFVFGVLELMTILPACHQLFRGLSYIGTRLDGRIIFENAHKRKLDRLTEQLRRAEQTGEWSEERCRKVDRKLRRLARRSSGDITDRMCFVCQSFAVVKTVLCVLPEMAALSQAPYDAGATNFNWYAYINGFRAMAWLAVSIVGVVWLCRVTVYCCRIAKDTLLWEQLAQACDEDERQHPERVPRKKLRSAMICLTVAFAFCVNLQMEGINYLPGFVTPLAMLGAVAFLWPYLTRTVRFVCTAVYSLGAAISIYFYVSCLKFFTEYDIVQYNFRWDVREAYDSLVLGNMWMELAFMLLALVATWALLCSLIGRYAGKSHMGTHQYTSEQLDTQRKSALKRHLLVPAILGVVMIVVRVVYYAILPEEGMVWVIDFAVAVVFAVFASLRTWNVRDELNVEHMLETDLS